MIKYYLRQVQRLKSGTPMLITIGQNWSVEPVDLNQIAEEISGTMTATKGDVLAVITELERQMVNCFRQNISVRFGILGAFRPTMRSVPSRTSVEFTKANIKRINVVFTPSPTMKYRLKYGHPEMVFQQVEPPIPPNDGE